MAQFTAKKFQIATGNTLLTLNAPATFKKGLGALPAGVKITINAKNFEQILFSKRHIKNSNRPEPGFRLGKIDEE